MSQQSGFESQFSVWAPRVIIALCVILLVYFTQRTYRFKGSFDETFLAPANLNLVRGPFAKEEYYKRGELGYAGAPLFSASEEVSASTEAVEVPADVPAQATETIPATQ